MATTMLFTDVEGSTRLLRKLGDSYGDVLAEHRRVVRDAFTAHGGREVDTQGDAFFFTFDDPTRAANAALAAQSALAGGPIRVRMGLHTGEPSQTEEGYVGIDVHLAARISAAAHGGQIVLSKQTRDLLEGVVAIDQGEHRVKDFDTPVWLFQLGDEAFPPLMTISNTNLPRARSSFIGRTREVAELAELVRANGLVTLTGPGGSGKTRLAMEVAAALLGEFKNGVFWVPLAALQDRADVLPTIGRTIGAQTHLADHIGEREMLLALDNIEHVIDCAPELAQLVEACPNLTLLVTSRELMRIRGEVQYDVLPLAEADAVQLFCVRAGLEPSPAIEELCRRLDDMPLALELAAARAKVLTPDQIVARLSERLDLFRGGRDADPRQVTLRATIEWSYDLLSPDEARVFRCLSVFAGGCTVESAEAVCETGVDTLQSLVEKSLVRHTDDRFWMLETIRDYASEQLASTGAAQRLRRRHAEHFLALAQTAGLSSEDTGGDRPAIVRPEVDNVRAAIDWAASSDLELAFRLVIAMEQFWAINDAAEGLRRIAALLEHGSDVAPLLRARGLRILGEMTGIAVGFAESTPIAEAALAEFERLGDERGVAVMRHRVAVNAWSAGDLVRARELLEGSLAICRRFANPKLEADVVRTLGGVARDEGDTDRALELLQEGARLCAQVGNPWIQAATLLNLAELHSRLGQLELAEDRGREALGLAWHIVARQQSIFALAFLATYANKRGDAARAGRILGAIEAETLRAPLSAWDKHRDEWWTAIGAPGNPEFERARHAGRTMTMEGAVRYALDAADRPDHTSKDLRQAVERSATENPTPS
jgi:predicted ATPase